MQVGVCMCGPTLFLLGHVVRVAFAVCVVALLLPRGLYAAALRLVYLFREITWRGPALHQHLELLTERMIDGGANRYKKTRSSIYTCYYRASFLFANAKT